MRTLTFTTYVTAPSDLDVSRITDLILGPSDTLYATTNYDGWVTGWDISGTSLTQISQSAHTAPLSAGAVPALAFVSKDAAPALLSGGHSGGNMTLRTLAGDGSFASLTNLGADTRFAGTLLQPTTVDLSDGTTAVYGGIVKNGGIAQLGFDADGALIETRTTASDAVVALTADTVAGQNMLFTASASDIGVSAWTISNTGTLTQTATITADDGLWVSAPTALASAVVDGTTYLVLAAAGSNSLSVLQVGTAGTLGVVDHVLDDRNTRFAGATVVETVQHDGLTYVITGGSDDGISVYTLLPGGRLQPRAHIADTPEMALANISAIAVQSRGNGLDLYAASASEPGLTRLHYDAGNATLITGTEAAETLSGGAGDDILFDGAGRDTLTGSAGADTFVLARDGTDDVITDFTLGEDTLDLSGWTGLRSINQLFLTQTSDGFQITYGDETLSVISSNGQPIAISDLSDTDLLSGARIPQVIAPGEPGPVTEPPALPDRPVYVTPQTPTPPQEPGIERIGTALSETLNGTGFDDKIWGLSGNDILFGNDGDDMLSGGTGADRLLGGAGNDVLLGGGGRDMGWASLTGTGSENADQLFGSAGNDRLWGNAGADRLSGGSGNDILWGGAGRDTFIFQAGQDRIADMRPVSDTILLDDGLWSGPMTPLNVVNTFGSLEDGDAILDFGNGNVLTIDDVSSLTSLVDTIAFF